MIYSGEAPCMRIGSGLLHSRGLTLWSDKVIESMRIDPVSEAHREALSIVIPTLEAAGVWYRATGGLAGNLHGSDWPLHDIDLDYRRADWPLIEGVLASYLVSLPQLYEDQEFRIMMAVARIGPVVIEFCQLEDGYVAGPSGWQLLDPDPERRERRERDGLQLWTVPIADLIHYKGIIRRHADLADLQRLVTDLQQAPLG